MESEQKRPLDWVVIGLAWGIFVYFMGTVMVLFQMRKVSGMTRYILLTIPALLFYWREGGAGFYSTAL